MRGIYTLRCRCLAYFSLLPTLSFTSETLLTHSYGWQISFSPMKLEFLTYETGVSSV